MVKTTFRTVVWVAVTLALLTALVGVTPTEAGEFVRSLWSGVLEFIRSLTGHDIATTPTTSS